MNFITVTNTNNEKVILNTSNIVSFHVTHPKENQSLTTIETTSFGCRYYVNGDITKELSTVVKAQGGTMVSIMPHV